MTVTRFDILTSFWGPFQQLRPFSFNIWDLLGYFRPFSAFDTLLADIWDLIRYLRPFSPFDTLFIQHLRPYIWDLIRYLRLFQHLTPFWWTRPPIHDQTRVVRVYYPLQVPITDWLLMFANQTQVRAQFQITDFFRLFSVRFCTVRLRYVFIYCLKIGSIVNDNDMLSYSLTTMMCFLTKEWYGFPAYSVNLFIKAYHKIMYKEGLKIT